MSLMDINMSDSKTESCDYDIAIGAVFKTLLTMENDSAISHEQFLRYADISEEEYVNLALTLFSEGKLSPRP